MLPITKALSSSVGKKLIMGLSGLALVGFMVTHLLGNLSLYMKDGTTFNLYAHGMMSWGRLLTVAEIGLGALFAIHIVLALGITMRNKSSRPSRYQVQRSKGGQSLSNISSRNMIITGMILGAFVIFHVWQFRLGPGMDAGYVADVNGVAIRDLHKLVYEVFGQPLYVALYVGVMLMLGLHMRHGFWSAFQSLGAMNARLTKPVYAVGVLTAIVIAAGFLFIPLWIYFDIPGALQ